MAKLETATFGAGCFWGVEDAFMNVRGVKKTEVGFMGGKTRNPTYEEVCTDRTGHAEVVHLKYDPDEVSYEELLEVFWSTHDPTTMNRQGPDVGSQYRSVIFYHNEKQKKLAEKSKIEKSGEYDKPVVTEIVRAKEFYRAEEHHQKYHQKHGISKC